MATFINTLHKGDLSSSSLLYSNIYSFAVLPHLFIGLVPYLVPYLVPCLVLMLGSILGSIPGSTLGSIPGSTLGSIPGSTLGSIPGSYLPSIDINKITIENHGNYSLHVISDLL